MAANTLLRQSFSLALLATCLCLVFACAARAEDRIYWADSGSNTISFAALDGSGGGSLGLGQGLIDEPSGLAIDPVTQRIYWANSRSDSIAFASLVGGDGGKLETGELTPNGPTGPSIDPVAERIYWADFGNRRISFGDLDGSFSGNLATVALGSPTGVVVDRTAGRLYWSATGGAPPVSFVNLDGSGGGDVNPVGASVATPAGLAIDGAHGRVYWANFTGNRISYANLDGSGGGDLATAGATVQGPNGVAIDPALGRIYWANSDGNRISYANLDGSGGADLPLGGAPPSRPRFPVLLLAPRSISPPAVTGGSGVGSLLSCSLGEWAPDLFESFAYQAPQSFEYQWSRDGADIPGATGSLLTAAASGAYACRVTAANRAGGTTRTSAPLRVTPVAFGPKTLVTLRLASRRARPEGPIAIRVANANPFAVTGRLSVGGRPAAPKRRTTKLAARSFKVGARSTVVLRLKLSGSPRRLRAAGGRLPLSISAAVVDLTGQRRTVTNSVVVRLSDGR